MWPITTVTALMLLLMVRERLTEVEDVRFMTSKESDSASTTVNAERGINWGGGCCLLMGVSMLILPFNSKEIMLSKLKIPVRGRKKIILRGEYFIYKILQIKCANGFRYVYLNCIFS
jgi:hypothetical protein